MCGKVKTSIYYRLAVRRPAVMLERIGLVSPSHRYISATALRLVCYAFAAFSHIEPFITGGWFGVAAGVSATGVTGSGIHKSALQLRVCILLAL
jgi:hypothetical protein